MKETQMPPVHAANLMANSDNTVYRVEGIGYTYRIILPPEEPIIEEVN